MQQPNREEAKRTMRTMMLLGMYHSYSVTNPRICPGCAARLTALRGGQPRPAGFNPAPKRPKPGDDVPVR